MSHLSVQMVLNDPNYVPIMDESGNLLIDEDECFILASRAVYAGSPPNKYRTWLRTHPEYIRK